MEENVKKLLEELRVHLQADGGDLEFVKMEGKNVYLKLKGACGCCPHAMATIKGGIERILREKIDTEIVVERI